MAPGEAVYVLVAYGEVPYGDDWGCMCATDGRLCSCGIVARCWSASTLLSDEPMKYG